MLLCSVNSGGNGIPNHASGSDITPQSDKNSGRVFYGWVVLATGCVVALFAWGFYYSFGVFFRDIQGDFGASRAEVSLVASILICTVSLMGVVYGWATDKYGPRLPVGLGGILMCVGLTLGSRASTIWQLYISVGFIAGCGIGGSFLPYISTLVRWFVKMRGFVQGILVAGVGAGIMVMAPLSERLLTNYGWRTSFVIMGIAGLILFSVAASLVSKNPQEKGLLPYGVTESESKYTDTQHATPKPTRKDLSLREAMRTRDLWLLCGIRFTLPLTIFMVSTHLVNYAKDIGMSPIDAALLITIIGGVSIAGKIAFGHLADRAGGKKIIFGCTTIMVGLMIWLSSPMTAWTLRTFAVIYGLAYGGAFPIMNILVAEAFGVTHIGKITGFASIGSAVGGTLGPWLAGYIFDTTSSYSLAFLIGAGASLIAIVLIVPFAKHTNRQVATGQ